MLQHHPIFFPRLSINSSLFSALSRGIKRLTEYDAITIHAILFIFLPLFSSYRTGRKGERNSTSPQRWTRNIAKILSLSLSRLRSRFRVFSMNIWNVATGARPERKKEREKGNKISDAQSLPLITAHQTFIIGGPIVTARPRWIFFFFLFTSKRSGLAKEVSRLAHCL